MNRVGEAGLESRRPRVKNREIIARLSTENGARRIPSAMSAREKAHLPFGSVEVEVEVV